MHFAIRPDERLRRREKPLAVQGEPDGVGAGDRHALLPRPCRFPATAADQPSPWIAARISRCTCGRGPRAQSSSARTRAVTPSGRVAHVSALRGLASWTDGVTVAIRRGRGRGRTRGGRTSEREALSEQFRSEMQYRAWRRDEVAEALCGLERAAWTRRWSDLVAARERIFSSRAWPEGDGMLRRQLEAARKERRTR